MKNYIYIILAFFPWECKNNIQQKDTYTLISRVRMKDVEYNAEAKKIFHPQNNRDKYFVKELLRSLDDTLTKCRFHVVINHETISSFRKDTFAISVYDFQEKKKCKDLERLFSDTPFVKKFIDAYKAPIKGIFFLNNGNLCVVSRIGYFHDSDLKNEVLMNYIKRETRNRTRKID